MRTFQNKHLRLLCHLTSGLQWAESRNGLSEDPARKWMDNSETVQPGGKILENSVITTVIKTYRCQKFVKAD